MKAIRLGGMALVVLALLAAAACHGFFVSETNTQSVAVTPLGVILKSGDTYNLTATATTVGGSSSNVTTTAAWTTSDGAIAAVGANTGLVTAGATTGTATISAKSGGASGTSKVLVGSTAPPTTLTITCTSCSGGTIVPLSGKVQLTAMASINGINTDVTGLVTWTSDNAAVASVSSSGLVSGVTSCSTLLGGTCPTITGTVATTTSSATGTFAISAIE